MFAKLWEEEHVSVSTNADASVASSLPPRAQTSTPCGSCSPICATLSDRLGVVFRGHLQVVFVGNSGGVSEPVGDHVQRERACQIGLACGAQILKQPLP